MAMIIISITAGGILDRERMMLLNGFILSNLKASLLSTIDQG